MKFKFMLKYIPGIVVLLAFFAIMVYAVLASLAPENWYADKHDSKCEKLAGKTVCDCYNRFMDKAKAGK